MAVDSHMNKKVTNIVPFATLLCRLYDDLFSLWNDQQIGPQNSFGVVSTTTECLS